MTRGLGIVLLALVFGCTTLDDPPTAPTRAKVDAAVRRALVGNEKGDAAAIESARALVADYERVAGSATQLDSALALLAAAREEDRARRVELLESMRDDADDEIAQRLVDAALERDPVWLASELDSDGVYSDFAAFLNGITQTFAGAIQGNPIATLQPLVVGIEGVLHGMPLDPRDRARLSLERRLRFEGFSTDEFDSLADRVAQLRDQSVREELFLARESLERRAYSSALSHLFVASTLLERFDEVEELRAEINAAMLEERKRLDAALAVDPNPAPWGESGASGESGDSATARAEYVARLEALFVADRPPYTAPVSSQERVQRARDEVSRATWRFVFTGRRIEADPLRRHVAARRAETRSWLDVVAPIVWLPATIVRGVYVAIGNPVDDRALLDAQAGYVRTEPGSEERNEILRELAKRYERRDETWKALLALREAGGSASELEPLEEALAERMLESEGVDPAVRRARLEWLVLVLPGTRHAETAAAELAAPSLAESGRSVPLSIAIAACARVSPLRIDARLFDGESRGGEIDPPRLRIEGATARAVVNDSGTSRELVLALDTVQAARLNALADEWDWRFKAARAETYEMNHAGIPVELYAGFGTNGLAVYPRLLPEGYTRADRSLYE